MSTGFSLPHLPLVVPRPPPPLIPSSAPSENFLRMFPVPDEQPSRHSRLHQLLGPCSPRAERPAPADEGEDEDERRRMLVSRECLLSEDGQQRNFVFEHSGLGVSGKWRRISVVLPLPGLNAPAAFRDSRPRPEMETPFSKIKHLLKTRIVCSTADGEETVSVGVVWHAPSG